MSVNDLMLVAIALAACVRVSRFAIFTCLIFWAHWLFDYIGWLDAYGYYCGAALADAMVVLAAQCMSPISNSIRRIQTICLLFITVQIAGLLIWFRFYPPTVYNAVCTALYMALFISIISRDGICGGSRPYQANRMPFLASYPRVTGREVVHHHGDSQT